MLTMQDRDEMLWQYDYNAGYCFKVKVVFNGFIYQDPKIPLSCQQQSAILINLPNIIPVHRTGNKRTFKMIDTTNNLVFF